MSGSIARGALLMSCAALVSSGCGDNAVPTGEPLATAPTLTIIAHQDDDLLFMQPDSLELAASGRGLTNVYVTAGNNLDGVGIAELRYAGLRAAYATATGSSLDDWSCGWITLSGHAVEHCRLDAYRVSLVFLGYPDGGVEGELPHSLLHLWEGELHEVMTVAERRARYDQAELISTLAGIITTTAPTTIHTLEIAATHGRDHSDHMVVGALAVLAAAAAASPATIVAYRGYGTVDEPANQLAQIYARSAWMVEHYDACTRACSVACGDACPTVETVPHPQWLARRYAVAMRPGPLTGVLGGVTGCIEATDGGELVLAPCAPLPAAMTLAADGTLQTADGRCVVVRASGEVRAETCDGTPAERFRIDDEGHVWSGVPPSAVAGMDYAHLWCLGPDLDGGHVRAALCGRESAPTWQVHRPVVITPRDALGIAAGATGIRLIDRNGDGHADLCGSLPGEPGERCAFGDGRGGFAFAISLPDAPPLADPAAVSVSAPWIGDLDADGAVDWCVPSAAGPQCSLAADQSLMTMPQPWGFAQAGVIEPGAVGAAGEIGALADITGDGAADLCMVADATISCAISTGHGFAPRTPLLELPPGTIVEGLWLGDLDGDGKADVCAADTFAVRCTLSP